MFNWLPVWFTKYYYGGNSSRGDHIEGSDYYADTMYGYGGNDTFYSSLGADTFYGGSGIDTVNYANSTGPVKVDLSNGKGSNTFMDPDGISDSVGDRYHSIENIRGSDFNDSIFGSSVNNVLKGGGGHDWIHGGAGNDKVDGGSGNDIIFGGSGNDNLYGSLGNDRFFIEEGRDNHYGGTGHDEIIVSDQNDILIDLETGRGFGGEAEGDTYSSIDEIIIGHRAGEITVVGSSRQETFRVKEEATGPVQIEAGNGQDLVTIKLSDTQDFVENDGSFFDGGSLGGDDFLEIVTDLNLEIDLEEREFFQQGDSDNNVRIQGFEGVTAGSGDDILIDRADTDNKFRGGSGSDTFVFDHNGNRTTEHDGIFDFEFGLDKIDLDNTEINNWNDLLGESDGDYMIDMNGGVLIRTAENDNGQYDTIFLESVTVSELSENDFIF